MNRTFLFGIGSALNSLLIVTFFLSHAQALPFDASYDKLLISKAGHQWLSPLYSLDIGYDEMVVNLKTFDSEFYGLRFATTDEVVKLGETYRVVEWDPNDQGGWASEFFMDRFQNDFGITHYDTFANLTRGMTESSAIVDGPYGGEVNHVWFVDYHDSGKLDYYNTGQRYHINKGRDVIGSWLVVNTNPVPEPATLVLFGAGLAGLIGSRLRKKK